MSVSKTSPAIQHSATPSPSSDAEHERALFQLMGQLEQMLARLDTVSESKHLPSSLEIAKEILVELVEFSEPRFEKPSLTPLIDQVCDFYELTKRLERMLGGQSWNGFAALIGIKLSYSDEANAMFQQLGRDLTEIVGGFFQLFESRFQSTDQVSEWQAGTLVFLDDLIRRWNSGGRSFK